MPIVANVLMCACAQGRNSVAISMCTHRTHTHIGVFNIIFIFWFHDLFAYTNPLRGYISGGCARLVFEPWALRETYFIK